MPQAKGLSKMERANIAEDKARNLRELDRFDRVAKVLKTDATRLFKIEQEFIRDGLIAPPEAYVAPLKKPVKQLALKDDGAATDGDGAGGGVAILACNIPSGYPVELGTFGDQTYNRNKSQYQNVAVAVLQKSLSLCAPIELSLAQQTSVMKRSARVENQRTLARLLEVFTGISGEHTIDIDDRNDRAVAVSIVRAYRELGHRGKGFQLVGINFENGTGLIYAWKVDGCKCVVTNRFTKHSVEFAVPRMADIYVDLNWAETKATMRVKNGTFRKVLYPLFSKSDAASSAAKVGVHPAKMKSHGTRRIRCKMALGSVSGGRGLGVGAFANHVGVETPLAKRRCEDVSDTGSIGTSPHAMFDKDVLSPFSVSGAGVVIEELDSDGQHVAQSPALDFKKDHGNKRADAGFVPPPPLDAA
jgi:hypothetical protein